MGLSDDRICRKVMPNPLTRAPRGWNGLPKAGKELIEDGTVLLYEVARKYRTTSVFWTVTIPTAYADGTPFEDEDYRHLLSNWSTIVRRIFEELGRLAERKGLPNRWLYVVEPQERRFRETGVFAPHLHAVIPNRWNPEKRNPEKDRGFHNTGYWEITTAETDAIVARVIGNVMGKPVDGRSCGNLQGIKGLQNLFFYLTKLNRVGRYLSKGSKILEELQKSQWSDLLPANWYGCDQATRQQVRASVHAFPIGAATAGEVAEQLAALSEAFRQRSGRALFSRPHIVSVPSEDGEIPVAVCCQVQRLTDIAFALGALMRLDLHLLRREVEPQGVSVPVFAV